jgi:hypothetical protein
MDANWTDSLIAQVAAADERARPGRVSRLAALGDAEGVDGYPCPALAHEYFEEARLCWYVGAFVAAILMVQLAFEEFLRSQYRVAKGVGGELRSGIKVDRAGFAELIVQARSDGFLSSSEANELHALRKRRNPYVHTKDALKRQVNEGDTFENDCIQIGRGWHGR